VLAWLLTGCATTALGPPAGPAFDGAYQGASRLVGGGGPLCGAVDEQLALTVRDGTFDYPFLVNAPRTAPLRVQVATDGQFRGDMQFSVVDARGLRAGSGNRTEWATVTGRIVGSTMEGTIENLECTRQMSMQRR
jgi:hypothetical protein